MKDDIRSGIDDLVLVGLRQSRNAEVGEESKVAEVGTPTLDTPTTGDENPMEWLTNPVGLDITPHRQVTWSESGEIVSPVTKINALA